MSHETPVEDLLQAVGRDPNVNVPSEIYRNIRNKALEEAAVLCDREGRSLGQGGNPYGSEEAYLCATRIRALKVES